MSKIIEDLICIVCESQYKLVYDINNTSGFSKACPFCTSEQSDEDKENIDDKSDDE